MKRQKKSTTTVDIYYLECLINKLIRSNTNTGYNPQILKNQIETHINVPKKLTIHKQNIQLNDNKVMGSSLYQQKKIHPRTRPVSEGQSRKLNQIITEEHTQLPQRNNLLRQLKNQMMFTRQQLWTKQQNRELKIQQQEVITPLSVQKKPIKIFSINLKSSFKQVPYSGRAYTNLNTSNQRNFSPIRTLTERLHADLTGWQTNDDAALEWG